MMLTHLLGVPLSEVAEPLLRALGWTLLHFCWQGIAVAAALWCVLGLIAARFCRVRYAVACAALVLMVALPLATFARLAQSELAAHRANEFATLVLDLTAVADDGLDTVSVPLRVRLKDALDQTVPWLPAVWIAGVVLFLGRLSLGMAAVRRMKSTAAETMPREYQALLRRVGQRLGVERVVALTHSAAVQVPTVIGWLHPAVLVPVGFFTGLSPVQIEALLAHELAHIRRHDYLVSIIQSVVEALLFYHPAVWWVSRQVRREREYCCDSLAVAACGDVLAYARALSWLEEQRSGMPEVALGANGGVLKLRIQRLLGYREGPAVSLPVVLTLSALVLAAAGAYFGEVAHAQRKAAAALSVPALQSEANVTIVPQQGKVRRLYQPAAQRSEVQDEIAMLTPSEAIPLQGGSASEAGVASEATMERVYRAWANQDVRWIITDEERTAFSKLTANEDREAFVRDFWARRNPPGAAPDTYRDEIYRRIAYSNENFASNAHPGWTTDRGHIYIAYGNPDTIAVHTGGPYPEQTWLYKSIPGIGNNVGLRFVDTCKCGEYHYTIDNGSANTSLAAVNNAARILAPPQLHVAAQATGDGAIQGTVIDPTGALVAHAKLSAVNTDTGVAIHVQTDNEGRYGFAPVTSGPYNVEVAAPGFQRLLQENVQVAPGKFVILNLKLTVGTVNQSLNVPGGAATVPTLPAGPLRVSAGVMAKAAISQPAPIYPEIAKAAHVQGTVVLHAIISKTGMVDKIQVISGAPMLVSSAVEAASHWTYNPYLLNGQPMAVDTTINVIFRLAEVPPPPPPPPPSEIGAEPQPQSQAMKGSALEAPPASSQPLSGKPARISAGVMAGLILSQPSPAYPEEAKAAHVQGVVVLHAIIGKTGDIEELQIVSGPEMLRASAGAAVEHWKYKPYLLNGEPVEVATTISVNFTLSDDASGQAAQLPMTGMVEKIGGAVSAPMLIYQVKPEITPEAKAARFIGIVLVNLVVDANGHPQDVHVVRGVGMGLDEKAVDAAKQYRFKPAMKGDQPVPVELNVEVSFDGSDGASSVRASTSPQVASFPEGRTIREIDFKGLNSMTIHDVTERFDAANVGLRLETPYDTAKVRLALTIMRTMLAERGHADALIVPEIKPLPPSAVGITFDVKEGHKTKGTDSASLAQKPAEDDASTVRTVGGAVSAPKLVYQVEPEFTEEARKAKVSGLVLVNFVVDKSGKPQHVHVVRGVGHGLDRKAIEAVSKYRFQPAMEAGKPVEVALNVEVNFQIF